MTTQNTPIKNFASTSTAKGGVRRGKGTTLNITPSQPESKPVQTSPATNEEWVIEASAPINIMDMGKNEPKPKKGKKAAWIDVLASEPKKGKGKGKKAQAAPVEPVQTITEPVKDDSVTLEVMPANKKGIQGIQVKKAKNTSKRLFNRLWAVELDKLQLAAMANILTEVVQLEAMPDETPIEDIPAGPAQQPTDKDGNIIVLLPFEDAQVTVLNKVIDNLDATYTQGVFTLMPALVKFTATQAKHAKTLISEGYLTKEGKGYMVTAKTLTLFGVTMADIEANFKQALSSL